MELELDKDVWKVCWSERLISQPPPEPKTQHVFNTIVQEIDKVQEEQCLNFTLSTEDSRLVLDALNSDPHWERVGST